MLESVSGKILKPVNNILKSSPLNNIQHPFSNLFKPKPAKRPNYPGVEEGVRQPYYSQPGYPKQGIKQPEYPQYPITNPGYLNKTGSSAGTKNSKPNLSDKVGYFLLC